MKICHKIIFAIFLVSLSMYSFPQKIVVAHRGASGYLPEHTLQAKAMAFAMGADYIEQDLVMTRDDQVVVIHDITLDRTSDVALQYPGRAREDGRHYVIDFSLEELKTLNMREGERTVDGERQQIYPNRFPSGSSTFRIATFSEEIELIQGLNYSMNKSVGIYPEIKSPEFHLAEVKDLSAAVLKVMKEYGYNNKRDKVFLQTFSWSEIKRLREILMPEAEMDLNLVMLAGTEEEYQWMFNREGMREVGRYADGFGPTKSLIIDTSLDKERVIISDLVKLAHDNGMQVHPYTFRSDTRGIPDYAESFDDLLRYFYFEAGVDGIFTDFPDQAVKFLSNQ